jgi:hypothetical protein
MGLSFYSWHVEGGVDNVIADICTFLRREIFHVDGAFFNKTGMLAESLNFVIMKDLLCKLLIYFRVLNYMKVCAYNEFEYCKVFGYY